MRDLRIIYMGTPEFAVPALEGLVDAGYNVVAVITASDKPRGRGRKLAFSQVKESALKRDIPVLQPTNLKAPEFVETLRSFNANLQVVVAFRMLPEVVWSMPEYGTFNLHASLLPQYRGAAPINWAIINGEEETGVTTFYIKHEIDTGNILFSEKEPILSDDDAGSLHDRLMSKGGGLVLKTVRAIEKNDYVLKSQIISEELKAAPKIFKEDCRIEWDQSSEQIRNFVRGLSPFPAAWIEFQEKVVKIYKVEPRSDLSELKPGDMNTDGKSYLAFGTNDGAVNILDLRMEGKKRMSIEELLRGFKIMR